VKLIIFALTTASTLFAAGPVCQMTATKAAWAIFSLNNPDTPIVGVEMSTFTDTNGAEDWKIFYDGKKGEPIGRYHVIVEKKGNSGCTVTKVEIVSEPATLDGVKNGEHENFFRFWSSRFWYRIGIDVGQSQG